MARAGSAWIEGNNLHWIDSTGGERWIVGTLLGANTNREGSAWVEGIRLQWINEGSSEEYWVAGSLVAAASWRPGSPWVEGDNLHYIDDQGDERQVTPTAPWIGTLLVDGDIETSDWTPTPLYEEINDWIDTGNFISSTAVASPATGTYDFECTFADPATPAGTPAGMVISVYSRLVDIEA